MNAFHPRAHAFDQKQLIFGSAIKPFLQPASENGCSDSTNSYSNRRTLFHAATDHRMAAWIFNVASCGLMKPGMVDLIRIRSNT
jgi:hypothetical protein